MFLYLMEFVLPVFSVSSMFPIGYLSGEKCGQEAILRFCFHGSSLNPVPWVSQNCLLFIYSVCVGVVFMCGVYVWVFSL